jgi:hypothetical protein
MRRIRPALWVVTGSLGLLVGLGMAVSAGFSAVHLGSADDAVACETDFGAECVTERAAVLEDDVYRRYRWLSQEQKWLLRVPDGAPDLTGAELESLVVPRQDGQDELAAGTEVTLLYYGDAPAWIRLPSGAVLETGDHPRRSAPQLGWFALFAVAGALFGIGTGVRSGRAGGTWWRKTDADIRVGPAGVLTIAGMAGGLVQTLAGSSPWPGLLAGLAGAGLGMVAWRRAEHRAAAV